MTTAMRVLFVKPLLAWPRTSGHDVYCYFMMKELAGLGAEVSLATVAETDPRAIEGAGLAFSGRLTDGLSPEQPLKITWLQERFRSFWGVSQSHIESVRRLVAERRADVVVAFGLPALPFLVGADRAVRVWAMADEWIYHHMTQVRLTDRSTWHHAKSAVIKGAYERAYSTLVDRVWAVSDTDLRAARWLAGMRVADLLPNGVDTAFYGPQGSQVVPRTAVFWGRLDFEPNMDGLAWFFKHVWADVRREVPDAAFTIIGYQPTPAVARHAELPGVTLRPNVDDLRPAVCGHALVALPMVSGGGIKNKLLEGAAMARPIVCTPRACLDLRSSGQLPVVQATRPGDFVKAMVSLWNDPERQVALGGSARKWVQEYYSWRAPGRKAYEALRQSIAERTGRQVPEAGTMSLPDIG